MYISKRTKAHSFCSLRKSQFLLELRVMDHKRLYDEKIAELKVAMQVKYEAMDTVKMLQSKMKDNELKLLSANEEHLDELISIFQMRIKIETNEQKILTKRLHQINEQLSTIRSQTDKIYRDEMADFEQSLTDNQYGNDDDDIMNAENLNNLPSIQQMRDIIALMKMWYLDKLKYLNTVSIKNNMTDTMIKALTLKLNESKQLNNHR